MLSAFLTAAGRRGGEIKFNSSLCGRSRQTYTRSTRSTEKPEPSPTLARTSAQCTGSHSSCHYATAGKGALPTKHNYWDDMRLKEKRMPPDPATLPRINSRQIQSYRNPPANVSMLTRTFIHDALYNQHYGYFSKQVSIFSPLKPFQFKEIRGDLELMGMLGDAYANIDKKNILEQPQIWHTPTEIFKPWYGYSIADSILKQHDQNPAYFKTLVLYEIGAGNGTLMKNILDYFLETRPDVYEKTEYNTIEISSKLANIQQESSKIHESKEIHKNRTKIINKSIFDWDVLEERDCFVLAMEVIDNFPHDLVRYDFDTEACLQAVVAIDETGDYQEVYEQVTDPQILEFLALEKEIGLENPFFTKKNKLKRKLLTTMSPFNYALTDPKFLPTGAYQFFKVLRDFFPKHRLCLTDFSTLPDTIPGINAPVVQTRYKGDTIPCSTYLVQPGWFDIFFPTQFDTLKKIYDHVMDSPTLESSVSTHQQFLLENSKQLDHTTTLSKENPMLTYFENVKFLVSKRM